MAGTFLRCACPVARHLTNFGVRIGRTLQNCFAQSIWDTIPLPMAKRLVGYWLGAEPFCSARPVRAPKAGQCLRTWLSASKNGAVTGVDCERSAMVACLSLANGKAIGWILVRGGAVLQCAPRARTKGRAMLTHLAKRFQKRRGHRGGL